MPRKLVIPIPCSLAAALVLMGFIPGVTAPQGDLLAVNRKLPEDIRSGVRDARLRPPAGPDRQ